MNWYVIVWEQSVDVQVGLVVPGLDKWWAENNPVFGKKYFQIDQAFPSTLFRTASECAVRVCVVPEHAAPMIEFNGDEDTLSQSFVWVVTDGDKKSNRTIRAMAECKSWPEAMSKSKELWAEWVKIAEDENGDAADAVWHNLGSAWERFREEAVRAGYPMPPESQLTQKEAA